MPEEVKRKENSVENLLLQGEYLTKEQIEELKKLSLDDLEVSEELKPILNQTLTQTLIQPLSQKIDESRCTALSNITTLALTLSCLTDESKKNLGKQLMVFAAKEEYPSAYYNLGDFYEKEQNDAEAYKYYKKAHESAQSYVNKLPSGTSLKKKFKTKQERYSQKLKDIKDKIINNQDEIIDKVRSHDILPDNVRNRDELLPDKLLELAKFYKEIGAMKIVLTCYEEFLDQAMAYIKTTFAGTVNINTPLDKMARYFTDCPENPMNLAPMNLANELAEFYKDGVDGVVEKKEKKLSNIICDMFFLNIILTKKNLTQTKTKWKN